MAKVFKALTKDTTEVAVVEIEIKGYGTLIIERTLWAKKGGNEAVIVKEHGIDSKKIDAVHYGKTRTREYLNNLPSFTGEK
jgi:hypothetical protein